MEGEPRRVAILQQPMLSVIGVGRAVAVGVNGFDQAALMVVAEPRKDSRRTFGWRNLDRRDPSLAVTHEIDVAPNTINCGCKSSALVMQPDDPAFAVADHNEAEVVRIGLIGCKVMAEFTARTQNVVVPLRTQVPGPRIGDATGFRSNERFVVPHAARDTDAATFTAQLPIEAMRPAPTQAPIDVFVARTV